VEVGADDVGEAPSFTGEIRLAPGPVSGLFKTCQWIAGDGPHFTEADKCGAPCVGHIYCADHSKIAWRPTPMLYKRENPGTKRRELGKEWVSREPAPLDKLFK
jgi:hypothetical protein